MPSDIFSSGDSVSAIVTRGPLSVYNPYYNPGMQLNELDYIIIVALACMVIFGIWKVWKWRNGKKSELQEQSLSCQSLPLSQLDS